MITHEQEIQFRDYGCAAKCLIRLAEIQKKKITREEFFERFTPRYKDIWLDREQFGLCPLSSVIEIGRDLDLFHHATSIRDIRLARRWIKDDPQTVGSLVMSDFSPDERCRFVESFHCRLLICIEEESPDSREWVLYNPTFDYPGSDSQYIEKWSDRDFDIYSAHFVLFRSV